MYNKSCAIFLLPSKQHDIQLPSKVVWELCSSVGGAERAWVRLRAGQIIFLFAITSCPLSLLSNEDQDLFVLWTRDANHSLISCSEVMRPPNLYFLMFELRPESMHGVLSRALKYNCVLVKEDFVMFAVIFFLFFQSCNFFDQFSHTNLRP